MKTYNDNSILQAIELDFKEVVYTLPDGYKELREPSPLIPEANNKMSWIPTFVKEVNGEDVHSLHRVEFDLNNITQPAKYKGELDLRYGDGSKVEAEDATACHGTDSKIHLIIENKSEEKATRKNPDIDTRFILSKFVANDWTSPFYFMGGAYGIEPGGNGFKKDAVYSALYTNKETDALIHDGRKGIHCEEIGIADWTNNGWVTRPNPILSVSDFLPLNVLTTGIADDIFKVPDKYVMEIVSHIVDVGWRQGIAVCDTFDGQYEILNTNITKKQTGQSTMFHLFYTDKWMALASTVDDPNNIYLAEVITGEVPEPPVNGGSMKPVITIFNDYLKLVEVVPNATKYDWQCDKSPGYWIGSGDSINIPEHLRVDGNEFWCYATVDGSRTADSDRVVYGGVVEPPEEPEVPEPPTDNVAIANQIIALAEQIV